MIAVPLTEETESDYVCPNGHAIARMMGVRCEVDGCAASVVFEPLAHGMEIQRELDRMRRLFTRLEGAVNAHQKRHQPDGLLFAEAADVALWKTRDQIITDYAKGTE